MSDKPVENFLFEYRGADLILRSHDSHHFRVPRVYIINSSPVLEEIIQSALGDGANDTHGSLLLIQLPESGAILHSLLTFIFPVTPLTPSTIEEAMELLSVAQKYQMDSVLTHIRDRVARQNPSSTQLDAALHRYSLAQKYGLRQEALDAAQIIFKYPMIIEDKLDMVPGPSLYELWNYYEKFRTILKSDLTEFKKSGARGTMTGLDCVEFSSSQIPRWLDKYIRSITVAPNLFDLIEFNAVLARHINDEAQNHRCKCVSIPSQTLRNFWEALSSVVHDSFEKVSITDVDELFTRLKVPHRQSSLYPSYRSERILKPKLIRSHLLNLWTYPTRMLSFGRLTLLTSVSISQYWPLRRLSSKTYSLSPSLLTVNPSMAFPWSNCPRMPNCFIHLCRCFTPSPWWYQSLTTKCCICLLLVKNLTWFG